MLSLYIHIPFCKTKCPYCSFQVCPIDQMKSDIFDAEIKKYVDSVISEIKNYSNILTDKEIKSIYFGGGTPQLIGSKNIEKIIDTIVQNFDTENVGELSVEMNPYPKDEVLDIVKNLTKKYRFFSRVRFSFGIQSLDNKVLSTSGRDITYPGLVEFFRELQPLKKDNNIFNLDFIAFGKFNQSKKGNFQLRNNNSLDFFQKLAESKFIDSYSVYTLELFPGSLWYYKNSSKFSVHSAQISLNSELGILNSEQGILDSEFGTLNSTDDDIYEEFSILKDILLESGYKRYELSNFSLLGKSSIHNRVYREMGDYIGLGTSASSFIKNPNEKLKKHLSIEDSSLALRRTNTVKLVEYDKGNYLDQETIQNLSSKDLLIEEFFLYLRTDLGIKDISKYTKILVSDYKQKIQSYSNQGFLETIDNGFKLTDEGMDIYNDIITELLQEI